MAVVADQTISVRSSEERTEAAARLAATKALLRDRRRQLLADTARLLLEGRDPDEEVMPLLFRALAAERIVDATLGFIRTDLESGRMKLGFIHGFPTTVAQRCLTLDFGQAICGTVAAQGRAMHVTNIQRSLDPLAELVRSAGINAYACEPLIVGGTVNGTLSFASRTRRNFDAEDLIFFRAIARHVAQSRARRFCADA